MPTSKFKVQRSGIRGLRFVIPVENGNPDSSELGYVIQTFNGFEPDRFLRLGPRFVDD